MQGGGDGNASAFMVSETAPEAVAALGNEPFVVDVSVDLIREVGLDLERVDDGLPGHVDVVGGRDAGGDTSGGGCEVGGGLRAAGIKAEVVVDVVGPR